MSGRKADLKIEFGRRERTGDEELCGYRPLAIKASTAQGVRRPPSGGSGATPIQVASVPTDKK